LPSCRSRDVLPCRIAFAATIRPPNAWAIAWCPRQTPMSGTFPANAWIAASVTPAESGLPGPGEKTMACGASAAMSATVTSSFLTTFISAPSLPNSCTRL